MLCTLRTLRGLPHLWVPPCEAVHHIDTVSHVEVVHSTLTVQQEGAAESRQEQGGRGGVAGAWRACCSRVAKLLLRLLARCYLG